MKCCALYNVNTRNYVHFKFAAGICEERGENKKKYDRKFEEDSIHQP
jgi:hypothetical protein